MSKYVLNFSESGFFRKVLSDLVCKMHRLLPGVSRYKCKRDVAIHYYRCDQIAVAKKQESYAVAHRTHKSRQNENRKLDVTSC